MKRVLFIMSMIASTTIYSQVGIGTTTPDNTAALDITSTTSGLLIPRMTEAQRLAIVTPATGLMVYETDTTPGFWYYDGTIWTTFGADLDWTVSGNDIYNANTGNVGVGTASPATLFHLEDPTAAAATLLNDGFEDSTIAPFTTGGNANWTITTAVGEFNSGAVGAKSGNIADSETSWIETTVNVTAGSGATVSFAYKTASESCCDLLYLYIDGVDQTGGAGLASASWATTSYPIATGVHTIRWAFEKDFSVSTAPDEMYLDDILIVENSAQALFRLVDGNQADGRVLMSDATGNAIWRDPSNVTDDDWRFLSGSTESDELYRTGRVTIGSNLTTTHHLDVDNGSATGTQIGIGSIEYIEDASSLTLFSDTLAPLTDGTYDLGGASNRWGEVYAVNGVINTSDARLKEDITPLNYGLKEIMSLKPVSYTWKNEQYGNTIVPQKLKEVKLGFLAQDLQQVIEEVVVTHNWERKSEEDPNTFVQVENERLGVSYSEIIPVAIKAIQEQQMQIKTLKSTVEDLKKQIKIIIEK